MTERSSRALASDATRLAIGPSSLSHDGDRLLIDVDEIAMPRATRVRGRIAVHLPGLGERWFALDAAGAHRWTPFAPRARAEVAFDSPALRWAGAAYVDGNDGDTPLEDAFTGWHWARADLGAEARVLYDVVRRDGTSHSLALRFDGDGVAQPFEPPPQQVLPATGWGIGRIARSDAGRPPRVVRTLENAPFYARSEVALSIAGTDARAVHESLSLDRFRRRVVQWMLPFRMPRRG